MISNEGSSIGQSVASELKDREALIVTFWNSFEDHEESHKSDSFQPLFKRVLELCENGNEEIAYEMLWSGAAYSAEEAKAAREAKNRFAA
jgi:heme-degrading monooxygenase HmoA